MMVFVLLIGLVGPRLTPTGVTRYAGDQRAAAAYGIQMAHMILENPFERLFLVQALRVRAVIPLPAGSTDHLGTGPCTHEVLVRAYSFFWIPYAEVTVRCGSTGVTR